MDLGQAASVVGRAAFGVVFGGFLFAVAAKETWKAARDLALRVTGGRVRATVVDVCHEPVEGESYSLHWVLVRFTTRDGRVMDQVRLRNWTSMPPRVGARVRVSYRRDHPGDADRAQVGVALVALLFAVPFCVVSGVLVVGVGFGVWGR